ncbi:HlyD family efflux transporter periplasmic adaptor subunit [Prolixibacteraceae bacterium JC049]|nr:HlyD family efflux transporter periplasmic adaptor subunit [Prolixibacteraceae bacterium JC049]
MPQNQEIEIRSEEVQDIVGRTPHWLLRSGMTLLFAIVAVLFLISYFFRYPDVVNAPVVLLSENPPYHLVARVDGRMADLLVEDKEQVKPGRVLAVLENAANFEHVQQLNSKTEELDRFVSGFCEFPVLSDSLVLGDVQSAYYEMLRGVIDYKNFVELEYYPREIAALKEQVKIERIYYDRLWSRRVVLNEELKIANNKYERDSLLYNKKVLSAQAWEDAKTGWLQKKLKFNDVRTLLAKTKREMLVLEQKLVGMEKEYLDEVSKKQSALIAMRGKLQGAISEWERKYLLRSTIAGKVVFNDVWAKNQQLKEGDLVCSVLPGEQKEIVGKIVLPMLKAGKVKQGQRVNIRLKNYPYMEFGVLVGKVTSVAEVPTNSQYVITVELPQDLKTTYGVGLRFSQEMEGSAEVVTENLRLIQRIINPLRSLLKNRVQ